MAFFNGWPWTQFQEQNLDWLIRQVKKNVQDISDNSDDIEELQNYLNPTVIQTDLYNIIQEMIDDGTLSGIVSQAAGAVVTPEMFGASGDGINDDSQAFDDAFDTGKIVYLSNKTYNVRAGITKDIPPVLIGDDATVLIGDNTWNYSTSVRIEGVTFESDLISSKDYISFSAFVPEFICRNCKFIDKLATDAARPRAVALRARATRVTIDNIYVDGITAGIIYNNSAQVTEQEYIHISHVLGVNVATLVDIEGAYGANLAGSLKNIDISYITLANTASTNISDTIGRDAVLAGGVININIDHVISSYAKERAVYLNNCSYGHVNDIIAYHSEGVKVSGTTATGYVRWITEYVDVSNVTVVDAYNAFALKVYDIHNCNFSNIIMDGGDNGDPDSFRAVELSRTAKNILIENVYVRNISRGIISFIEEVGYPVDMDSITIRYVTGRNICMSTSYDAVNFQQNTIITNINLEYFDINGGMDPYNASSHFAHFASPQNVTGLFIDHISAFNFSTTEEPIKVGANVSNLTITNTKLFYAQAIIATPIPELTVQSDYVTYTASSTSPYVYTVEVQRNPLKANKDIYVELPCSRNIYGPVSDDKDIYLEGPISGSIIVRSGTGTASTGFSYNAYGQITSNSSGKYYVRVIEE